MSTTPETPESSENPENPENPANATESVPVTERDVLIVGAGLSGIDAAYRIQERCPDLTYDLVEARDAIGGTWDLFRYPGVRSDSDFFTLALPFYPWTGRDAIVDGAQIRDYLVSAARRFGIDRHLRLGTSVVSADWSDATSRWTVRVDAAGREERYVARFLMICSGYYDYEHPHDPGFVGVDSFGGEVVHPQFWPEGLDCRGKHVAVIGSGATAITLVPALAAAGARVTMVQRTPGYVLSRPRRDATADVLRRLLPARAAHRLARVKNTAGQWALFRFARLAPRITRALLRRGAIAGVGSEALVDAHFTPPYYPWDQRLCVSPGGDFFDALRDGSARIVTGRVDSFVESGLRMEDGSTVEADVVVTATGLTIQLIGGITLTLDGRPVDLSRRFAYLGAMLGGVPNVGFCVGYINLSWTMRSDLTARLIARVLRRLVDSGSDRVVPVPPADLADLGDSGPLLDMQSGYLARAAATMPRATRRYPWAMAQDVVRDAWAVRRADLDDGLEWTSDGRGRAGRDGGRGDGSGPR